jgi:hypothetical protein
MPKRRTGQLAGFFVPVIICGSYLWELSVGVNQPKAIRDYPSRKNHRH